MKKTYKIYVAGPYSGGDVAINVREAIKAGDEIEAKGFAPYIPHLTHFWHMFFPKPYEKWLEIDNHWVLACDGLLRIPGKSDGADKEVTLAEDNNIPIFYSQEELYSFYLER